MRSLRVLPCLAALMISGLTACSPPGEPLSILAGSELKDLEPLLPKIDRCANTELHFTYIGTLDGAEELARGASYDIAWFSHGKYLLLLDQTRSRIDAQDKIMLSPVVMGVKQSKARAWGWENNPDVTWRDIADKAASGELQFAMTNPASSNSGFTALIGVASALSGVTEQFEPERLDNERLAAFFKGQGLTAGSSGWLADAYLREQDRLDGIINYESVLLQLNRGGKLKDPLTLIYPREGIITADYPIMLLNKDKRDAFDRLVQCLRSPDIQESLMRDTQRRPVIPQVRPDQRFAGGLLVELPFPRSVKQVDALLFTYLDEVRKPSNTLFVLDVSGSMEGQSIQQLKGALANLTGVDQSLTGQFARFRAREQVAMLPFSGKPHTLRNFIVNETDPDSTDMRALRDYIFGLTPDGGTAIYDALAAGYQILDEQMRHEPDHFYSIVLLTDGENTSGTDFDRFYGRFPEIAGSASAVKLFPILFGNSADEEMETLAEMTGGRTFDAHKHSLAEVFKKIRGYQ